LAPLFKQSLTLIDGELFKQELRTLLSKFSRDLDKSATKATELLAAKLVRQSRSKISFAVWREVYKPIPDQKIDDKNEKEHLSKARIMEQFLKSLNDQVELGGDDLGVNYLRQQKPEINENTSDDEDIGYNLPNLQQVKDFIVTGPAFAKFQERLARRLEWYRDSGSSSIKGHASSPVSSTPLISSENILATFLSYKFIKDISRSIERMLRPSVRQGYRRLEWQTVGVLYPTLISG
jgi:hypothetical protein